MPIAVIVEWFGPYKTLEALTGDVRLDWQSTKRALYMALGRGNRYRYIGLSTRSQSRIGPHHRKLNCRGNRSFFVGEIITQGISGRRRQKTPSDLSLAEHALIRYLQPSLNERRKYKDPNDYVSIFSCFYSHKDYETPTDPLPKFPELLAFNPSSRRWSQGRC